MVLVGVGAQRGQDGRVDVGLVLGEHPLVAHVHERLVGVVAQELLDVLGPTHRVVEVLGVVGLVVVQLEEQLERVVLEFVPLRLGDVLETALVLVPDVVAVHGLVPDDEPDDVGGVGELGARGPPHGQVEARVEHERLEHHRGDLALERVVTGVVAEDDLRLALEVGVLLRPAERLVDLRGRAQGGEDRRVALRVHGLHERDVGEHRLLVRGRGVGDHAHRADGPLDRVQQRESREDAGGHRLLVLGQGLP